MSRSSSEARYFVYYFPSNGNIVSAEGFATLREAAELCWAMRAGANGAAFCLKEMVDGEERIILDHIHLEDFLDWYEIDKGPTDAALEGMVFRAQQTNV